MRLITATASGTLFGSAAVAAATSGDGRAGDGRNDDVPPPIAAIASGKCEGDGCYRKAPIRSRDPRLHALKVGSRPPTSHVASAFLPLKQVLDRWDSDRSTATDRYHRLINSRSRRCSSRCRHIAVRMGHARGSRTRDHRLRAVPSSFGRNRMRRKSAVGSCVTSAV